MRLSLNLVVQMKDDCCKLYDADERGASMDDWAMKAAAKLKEQFQAAQLQDEAFVGRQRIKKANATPQWLKVREAVKQNCEAFNRETQDKRIHLEFEVVPSTEIRVRLDIDGSHRFLTGSFDAQRCVLEWSLDPDKRNGVWGMAIKGEDELVFVRGAQCEPITPEAMAKEMLNALLRINV